MKFKMKGLFSLALCCVFCASLWAETAENLIENYDLRTYSPQAIGAKDLVFRINVLGLTESLNQELSYGKLENVYFEVYWQAPNDWRIEVEGMPAGFIEKKTVLASLVVGYLGYVIPQKLAPKVSGYALVVGPQGAGYVIKGEDKSNVRGINKIEIVFDQEGKTTSFKTFAPNGVQGNIFSYKNRTWANNKWAFDRVVIETIQGFRKTVSETDIKFLTVAGFAFPETIKVSTKVGFNNGKELDPKTESKLELQFSKYEVNTGKAAKYFLKLAPKKKP